MRDRIELRQESASEGEMGSGMGIDVGWGDGRMVWVGWSLDSRLSRPGRHIGASHSKRSRARQVKVRSGSGSGQVGKEGTGQDRAGQVNWEE